MIALHASSHDYYRGKYSIEPLLRYTYTSVSLHRLAQCLSLLHISIIGASSSASHLLTADSISPCDAPTLPAGRARSLDLLQDSTRNCGPGCADWPARARISHPSSPFPWQALLALSTQAPQSCCHCGSPDIEPSEQALIKGDLALAAQGAECAAGHKLAHAPGRCNPLGPNGRRQSDKQRETTPNHGQQPTSGPGSPSNSYTKHPETPRHHCILPRRRTGVRASSN